MASSEPHPLAPPWQVERWVNVAPGPTLASLRGRVVALHAFQMLCPGCVVHGLPQALRLHDAFAGDGLVVVALHTVFEHHDAMTPAALEAFVHEWRWPFAVGVDRAATDGGPVPLTMRAYALRGTPSLVLIDRAGRLRLHHFGRLDDLVLGAAVGRLLAEGADGALGAGAAGERDAGCDETGCAAQDRPGSPRTAAAQAEPGPVPT